MSVTRPMSVSWRSGKDQNFGRVLSSSLSIYRYIRNQFRICYAKPQAIGYLLALAESVEDPAIACHCTIVRMYFRFQGIPFMLLKIIHHHRNPSMQQFVFCQLTWLRNVCWFDVQPFLPR